jgi:hypothetical protein
MLEIPGPPAVENPEVIHLAKLVKVETDELRRNIRWLVKRLQNHLDEPNLNPLNIRVEGSLDEAPLTSRHGSDSALREQDRCRDWTDCERGRLQADLARSQHSLQMAVQLKLKAQGELDAANQHVKILEADRNAASDFKEYVRQYFPRAFETTVGNLAAYGNDRGWDENYDSAADERTTRPDLAASPNSTPKDSPAQRIGVYDYDSLVACLRENFHMVFTTYAEEGDPQNMVQLMASEIQNLRRKLDGYLDNA